jgi:hypothetical protein
MSARASLAPDGWRAPPAARTVREGRDLYLHQNGFSVEAYAGRFTPARILGIPLRVPNPPRHRWAIMRHDLHHVATGYGTDLAGEAEISAWEARAGLAPLGLYTGAIVASLALLGLLVAPRRTLRAWRASRRRSLFVQTELDYDELLSMSLEDLRRSLALPEAGLARGER